MWPTQMPQHSRIQHQPRVPLGTFVKHSKPCSNTRYVVDRDSNSKEQSALPTLPLVLALVHDTEFVLRKVQPVGVVCLASFRIPYHCLCALRVASTEHHLDESSISIMYNMRISIRSLAPELIACGGKSNFLCVPSGFFPHIRLHHDEGDVLRQTPSSDPRVLQTPSREQPRLPQGKTPTPEKKSQLHTSFLRGYSGSPRHMLDHALPFLSQAPTATNMRLPT